MDIKLKKFNRKKVMEASLAILWVLMAMMFAFTYVWDRMDRRYTDYQNYYVSYNLGMIMFGYAMVLVFLTIIIVLLIRYLSKDWHRGTYQPQKADWIIVEVIAGIMLGILVLWLVVLRLYGYAQIYDGASVAVGAALITAPLSVLFMLCVIVLYRKYLLGILKQTSVLWKVFERERVMEYPFDQHERKRQKLLFVSECIIFTGLIIALLAAEISSVGGMMGTGGNTFLVIFCIIGISVAIWRYDDSKLYGDLATVIRQIEVMKQGNFNTTYNLDSESPLFQTMENLHEVRNHLEIAIEKQVKDEKMKIDLITNVSHDLKTPLTSMISYIDLLKKEELSPEARDYVDVLAQKHEHLKGMILDLFELSKVSSGTEELKMEVLDMTKLIEQTLGDLEEKLSAAEIELRKKLPEEPAPFAGDGTKVYRILQNLLENTMKYSMKGTRVYLSLLKEGGKIEVMLQNTSACEMHFTEAEIIERFTRGDESRTEEGNGLGLAIVNSFANAMGGTFKIKLDGDQFKAIVCFPEKEGAEI